PPDPIGPLDPEQQYREAVAHYEKQLVQGKEITLIGPDMRTVPFRWVSGEVHVRFPENPAAEGVMAITSQAPALLELLPASHCRAYSILVELRQEASGRAGNLNTEAGVAFGCSYHSDSVGKHCFFSKACFADLGGRARIFRTKAGQPCNLFQLGFAYRGVTNQQPYRLCPYGGPAIRYIPQELDGTSGPWHQLRIEITPDKLQATWDAQTIEWSWAAEVSRALACFRAAYPELRELYPKLTPRGAIGLYLEGC